MEWIEVPADLIFNWDQTGILLVPSAQWTMDKKGRKRFPFAGHNDKRRITALICGALPERCYNFNLFTQAQPKDATHLTIFLVID